MDMLGIILPLLLGVGFLVLAKRKVMAFLQRQKGPNVVRSFRLLQLLVDGLKLILKELISPSSANFSLFRMALVATFMLSLVAQANFLFHYFIKTSMGIEVLDKQKSCDPAKLLCFFEASLS